MHSRVHPQGMTSGITEEESAKHVPTSRGCTIQQTEHHPVDSVQREQLEHLLEDGQSNQMIPTMHWLSLKGRILQGSHFVPIALTTLTLVSCILATAFGIMLNISPASLARGAIGPGEFRKIQNGTCLENGLFPVVDKERCMAGAGQLGLADTTLHVRDTTLAVPEGCYVSGGTSLWMSRKRSGRSSERHKKNDRKPICMTSGGLPQVVQEGSCAEEGLITITAREVCEASALELNIADTTVTFTSNLGVPFGCYTKGGTQLWIGLKEAAESEEEKEHRDPICMTRGGNPQRITSGTCTDKGLDFITRREGCEDAAKKLGLPDITLAFTSNLDVPFGCYAKGDELWMGIEQTDVGEVRRNPICVSKGNKFAKLTLGSCAQNGFVMVYNPETCEAGARELKLNDTTVSFTSDPEMPRGCYYKGDKELWMNTPKSAGERRLQEMSPAQDREESICGSKPPYLVHILA